MAFKYSLVIATLEDNGDLALCLESLAAMHEGESFEAIVVDQNDDDRLVSLLSDFSKHFPIRHERVSFRNASKARNHGARIAQGQ